MAAYNPVSEFLDPPTRSGEVAMSDGQALGIEEAAAELGVETHVLTFWEGMFPRLTPKTESGRRYYSPQDMAMLRYIRISLIDRRLSVTVVRRRLKRWKGAQASIKSILQTTVEDGQTTSPFPPESNSEQTTEATVRNLHSAVADAAKDGAFAGPPEKKSPTRRATVALKRLEEIMERLEDFRSRLLQPPK